ncbi:SAM-dependent methyltransferase [Sulfurospirillum diekertiae]|uniref:SAM-dependent methyltransferase n=1 Tax=Sulfurospirillum diekertiae TaxID=1854492 RepID=UPI003510848E
MKRAFGDAVKVLHVKRLEAFTCKEAFFVANEIFDAFPCELIKEDQMLFIEKDQAFFETMDSETKAKAKEYGMSKGELCLEYEPFADAMNQCCERFEFVTFDYGDKEARGDFSLRVYANHQVYPFFALTDLVEEKLREKSDFNGFFAKADITYDVNFSHLFYAFEKNGIHVHDYATQMKALVDFGLVELLELFAQNVSEKQYEREMNKIKTLIDPSFMGERFKMACFRKGEA